VPDDSVLPHGDRRDQGVDMSALRFVSHSESKSNLGPNSPP
jgi:hypothetical protein